MVHVSVLTPLPTQLSGARFLASRKAGLLADQPRVGKTGAAILAADYEMASPVLVITTASGRAVWERAWREWSNFGRRVQVLTPKDTLRPDAEIAIVGWGSIADGKLRVQLLKRRWALVISDEDHAAKSFEAARTKALYGELLDDGRVMVSVSIAGHADRVWCLTGTPLPNSPLDAYPRLRVLAVDRLAADPARGWPDVTGFEAFRDRYCVGHPMKIGRGSWARWTYVVTGGRNEEELAARIGDFMLLRTQADVGIRAPIYETWPLIVSDANRRATDKGVDAAKVLAAADADDTRALEMHMGPKRRLIGEVKARAIVEAVSEEFAGGLDKIVLAYWHVDVGNILADGLSQFGVVKIDGATSGDSRAIAEQSFRHVAGPRVFLAQIVAAGEAIDLSASAELAFVEISPVPKDMKQMSLRITNHTQTRQARVRVATIAGSIDDALQALLLPKWSSIRKVLA